MGRKRVFQIVLVLTLGLGMGSANAAPLQQEEDPTSWCL